MVIDFRHKNSHNSNIEIISYHPTYNVIGANDKIYPIPSVIRVTRYFNLYNKTITFSRKNLLIRDNFLCQYCGKNFPNNQLTYDHVVPKSRYKPDYRLSTNWTNIVTSCRTCNAKKGNKTPNEAGMKLLKNPCAPKYDKKYLSWHIDLHTIHIEDPCYDLWKPYLNINHE
jgi:5-methylcytosine-specific restriction endonuclease McrA